MEQQRWDSAFRRSDLDRWIEELRQAAGPALSANRTMGSLGGLVASRIAREFRIGGPSFTVSCDETSGIQALAIAVDWLRRGELDAAIVGAVDFAGDIRAVLARHRLQLAAGSTAPIACDGAVCLVLKRLDDAQRDGDQIYATIRDVGSQSACVAGQIGGYSQGSIERDLGHAGAASGLAAVAKTALESGPTGPADAEWPSILAQESGEGPRRATVNASSLGGNHQFVTLEEAARTSASHSWWSDRIDSTARRTTARSVRHRGR